jgi:hypothetical protein
MIVGVAGMAAVVYGCWVRPRLSHWGASDEEVAGPFPGSDVVPGGRRGATIAVTINATAGSGVAMARSAGWGSWGVVLLGSP